MYFESNNANLLYACSLLYLERLFSFAHQTQLARQHGGVFDCRSGTAAQQASFSHPSPFLIADHLNYMLSDVKH